MKKKLIGRGLLGFPLGIAVGYIITIVISVIWGNGHYAAATPELVEAMGDTIRAVILQAILCGIMGSGFAMASVIWEMDTWSLAKQSGVYFAIACVMMLPIAYVTHWMEHSVTGVLFYMGVFALIFLMVWAIQYFAWKNKIEKMNESIGRGDDVT